MIIYIVLVFIILFLTMGTILIVVGTIKKNKWGINLNTPICTKCKNKLTYIRKPKSLQQALWGGHTCEKCNVDIDKWGREVKKP